MAVPGKLYRVIALQSEACWVWTVVAMAVHGKLYRVIAL